MITLDQVFTLDHKVESAVVKIQQLQAENDALRKQCAELTNALSSKSEQLSSFESNQSQIESGILNALDRLNQIENSVLKVAGQDAVQNQTQPQIIQNTVTIQNNEPILQQTTQSFDTMQEVEKDSSEAEEEVTEDASNTEESSFEPSQTNYFQDSPALQDLESSNTEETHFVESTIEQNVEMNIQEYDQSDLQQEYDFSNEEDSSDNLGFDIF
ncbi:MAG: cell division protein ZapB [Treponema bryantii]|nr:cell division protein ZapB [Treponema bryantii]